VESLSASALQAFTASVDADMNDPDTGVCKEASKLQLRYIEVKTGDERCYQHPRYSQPLVPQEQQTTCPEGEILLIVQI